MFFCSSWVTASGYKFPLAIVEWTVQYTCEDRTKVRVNSICVKSMTNYFLYRMEHKTKELLAGTTLASSDLELYKPQNSATFTLL